MSFRVSYIRRQGAAASLKLTLPPSIVRELGVRDGDPVALSIKNGLLVVVKLSASDLARQILDQDQKLAP